MLNRGIFTESSDRCTGPSIIALPSWRLEIVGTDDKDLVQVSVDGQQLKVQTGNGDTTVLGGEGDDQIQTADGDNFVDAGAGDDQVQMGNGNDVVLGGAGNDKLEGGKGADILRR